MSDYVINIRHLLDDSKFTRDSFVKEVEIGRRSLDHYLNGKTKMTVEVLERMCKVLDVNICEVLTKDFSHANEFTGNKVESSAQEEVTEPQIASKLVKEENKYLQSEVEELRSDKSFLRDQVRIKDKQIETLHDVINTQLPSKQTG